MEHTFYLAFRRKHRGYRSISVRSTERQPHLDAGEVCIRCKVSLPEALFTRPLLTASIGIAEEKITPATISADVAQNIVEIVKQQTGLDLKLIVDTPEIPTAESA